MLSISYSPLSVILTTEIPTQITINTDAAEVSLSVTCNTTAVFSTTLYPYNNKAMLHDLRSILEAFLIELKLPSCSFSLTATAGSTKAQLSNIYVVFSRINISMSGWDFTAMHFLSSSFSELLPSTKTQTVSIFSRKADSVKQYTDCVIRLSDEDAIRTIRMDEGTLSLSAGQVLSLKISPSTYREFAADYGELLAFTVHRGDCVKTFYLNAQKPTFILYLLNEFLAPEWLYLQAVTKSKLDFERDFATADGETISYNDDTSTEYETETAFLSYSQATRIARILLSPQIFFVTGGVRTEITVTDITAEISDARGATNAIKFKWKFRKPQFASNIEYADNIFDPSFTKEYT